MAGDIPAPADFDGDSKADLSIFRPSTGQWWILQSSNGSLLAITFGQNGDSPVPADYDGDGKADIAVSLAFSLQRTPKAGRYLILMIQAGIC
jgi:hypothetical protein